MTDQQDVYSERSYGGETIGFGSKPGIAVVDFQLGFTDPSYTLGGSPLVQRAVQNSARLLLSLIHISEPTRRYSI